MSSYNENSSDEENKPPNSNGRKKNNSGSSQSSTAADKSNSGSSQTSKAADNSNSGSSQVSTAADDSNSGSSQVSTAADNSNSGSSQVSTAADKSNSGSSQTSKAADKSNSGSNGSTNGSVADLSARHRSYSESNIANRKRSRSVGSAFGVPGSTKSNNDGCTTPIKKTAPTRETQKPIVKTEMKESDSKCNNLASSSCASFAKDMHFRGDRFGSAFDPMAAVDEFVAVIEMNQQRARFVFRSGQEVEATPPDFNRIFQRLQAAPQLVIRLEGRVHYFSSVQYWNIFVRTVSNLTVEGNAHDADVHFILDRCYHLRYLQLIRINVAGRHAGTQPTSLYGDVAYHLPHNLAAVSVDCRGFGNGGFLHVLKHTAARMYQCDRHQLDHATFVVADFPRLRALDQYVNDIHFWIYSCLTIIVARPPDDNYIQLLNQRQFYLIGKIRFSEIDDTFVIYRCNVGQIFLQIGFVFPRPGADQ